MAQHEPDFGDLLKSITDRIDTLERRAQVTPGTIIGTIYTSTEADTFWSDSSDSGFLVGGASISITSDLVLKVRITYTADSALNASPGSTQTSSFYAQKILINGNSLGTKNTGVGCGGNFTNSDWSQVVSSLIYDRVVTLNPGTNLITTAFQRSVTLGGSGAHANGSRNNALLTVQVLTSAQP